MEFVILNAIGEDRVGIVDDLAGFVSTCGGNIEESRMAVLGGDFAVIMLVSGSGDSVKKIVQGSDPIGQKLGLSLTVRKTKQPSPALGGRPYSLESVSLDAPGILHAITSIFKENAVAIEEVTTVTSPAPMTGAPMFIVKASVIIPKDIPAGKIKEKLLYLAEKMDLDLSFKPLGVGD